MSIFPSHGIVAAMLASLVIIACSGVTESSVAPGASSSGASGAACTGANCTSNGEACSDGKLDCNGDSADGCEVDGANDPSSCGACGKPCPAGHFCANSVCVDRCPPTKATCGRVCVDTKTDAANCGGCGNVCPAGASCAGAICVGACAESPCKLIGPQCGCATGQACYVDDSSHRACLTAGTIAEGQTCTAGNDTVCAAGLFCDEHKIAGESSHVCTRMCLVDSDCKGEGSVCKSAIYKGGVKACSVSCDPTAQTGCGVDTKCSIVQAPQGETYSECSPRGTSKGQQGASCTLGKNTCAPGYTCVGDNINGTITQFCAKYCKDTDCTAGTSCLMKIRIKNGTTSYGACFPN